MAAIYTDQGANTFLPPSPVVPMFLPIIGISRSLPMIITVKFQTPTSPYIVGQLAYLSVPFTYGMYQANALTVRIISINGNNFSVNADSTEFDPFVIPAFSKEQPAVLAPAGSRNTYNFTTLPFRALNGMVGN
jgi:hypothetical protein